MLILAMRRYLAGLCMGNTALATWGSDRVIFAIKTIPPFGHLFKNLKGDFFKCGDILTRCYA